MIRQRIQNIEHPDLTGLLDEELYLEGQYLGEQVAALTDKIRLRSALIGHGYKQTDAAKGISTLKIVTDLQLSITRQQAIADEISYRAEMMR